MSGFLNKLFGKPAFSETVNEWLKRADDAYVRALESKDVRIFQPFCTVPMSRSIIDTINSGNIPYFGLPKYRKVQWVELSSEQFEKILSHDHVKVNARVSVALGDDITEIWSLVYVNNEYRVDDISRK